MTLKMTLEDLTSPLFLSGICFCLAALVQWLYPPKTINSFYGYRTARSTKNQENWNFAQTYSNRFTLLLGLVFIAISALSLFFKFSEKLVLVGSLLLIFLGVGAMIWFTESKLKKMEQPKSTL